MELVDRVVFWNIHVQLSWNRVFGLPCAGRLQLGGDCSLALKLEFCSCSKTHLCLQPNPSMHLMLTGGWTPSSIVLGSFFSSIFLIHHWSSGIFTGSLDLPSTRSAGASVSPASNSVAGLSVSSALTRLSGGAGPSYTLSSKLAGPERRNGEIRSKTKTTVCCLGSSGYHALPA